MHHRPTGAEFIMPFLDFLDWVIREYGLEIYIVVLNLTPFLIVWIFSGGFWRRPPRRRVPPKLPKNASGPSTPPRLDNHMRARTLDRSGEDSFAA